MKTHRSRQAGFAWVALALVSGASSSLRAATPEEQARQEFERGVELAQAGRLGEAVIHFDSAYRAAPRYAVLYNLGLAYGAIGKPAEAVHSLEQYLEQGGADIAEPRRQQVGELLARYAKQTGFLRLRSEPDDAEVYIDGRSVGKGPISNVRLAVGQHAIVVVRSGYRTHFELFEIAGESVLDRTLRLEAEPDPLIAGVRASERLARVWIDCAVPDLRAELDGTETSVELPGPILVTAGPHTVVLRRQGYRASTSQVVASPKEAVRVGCGTLAAEPVNETEGARIELNPFPKDSTVRVDGVVGQPAILPVGKHRIELTRHGYVGFSRVLELPAGRTRLDVELSPTPEFAEAQNAARKTRKTWAYATAAFGTAATAAGLIVYAVASNRFSSFESERSEIYRWVASGEEQGRVELAARNRALQDEAALIERLDSIAVGSVALGAAALVASGFLWGSLGKELKPDVPSKEALGLRWRHQF